MRSQFTPKDIKRFWSHVDLSGGPDACWLWTKGTDVDGYGRFAVYANPVLGRTGWRSHRAVWLITHGTLPDDMFVCHECDTPSCVNPAHLFLGTAKDNVDDMHSKGRHAHESAWNPRGETNPKAKLTDEDVLEMRRRWARGGISKSQLGRDFGVSSTMASWVILQRFWKHLPSVDELKESE